MPVIRSAQKKLRADKIKEKRNNNLRNLLKKTLKLARKNPTPANLSKATKILDKLAKRKIIHKNKAARIKSTLSKIVTPKKKQSEAKKA